MIQDIYPHKLNNHFHKVDLHDEAVIMLTNDRLVLACRQNEGFRYIRRKEVSQLAEGDLRYLFSIDEKDFFGYFGKEELAELYEWLPVSALIRQTDNEMSLAYCTAVHLLRWYRNHRYCGRCGQLMQDSETERAMICPDCGSIVYPVIAPAVIVGVTNGDQLLMSRYANRGFKGHALIAGFCEIGETVEETVRREVREETGLEVTNIRYYKSQPWGMAGELLMGFYCDVDGDDTIHVDHSELATAEWIRREDIEKDYFPGSLTGEMIQRFRDNSR